MRITIVSALVVLFISAVTSQTVPQLASLEDGCFYTDGELFGCLKTTVLSCDSSWFFQLVKPLESDPQTSYVFAEGEVYAGVEFYECYQQENQCAFCLAFTNSQVIGNQMSTQTQIYVTCDALSQPLMYDFGELTGSGVDCGSPGYYSPPCYSFEYYDFTSTHSGPSVLEETLGYYIQAYSVWNVDEIMRVSGNCVYLKPIDCESFEYCDSELWVKLYCPDVLMDTCSQTAMLESHGGLLIVIPDISSGDFCVSVAGGHVCVNTDTIYYSYTYLSTSLELRVTNEWGYTLGALSWMMYPQFPACGFGSWECNNVFPTGSIWYEPFTWITWNSPSPSSASSNHKHQSSKHHKSSNTSKSSNSSNDSDDGNAALITSLTLTGALVLLAVFLGSVYIIYRITIRARSNSSEDVYSMMLQ